MSAATDPGEEGVGGLRSPRVLVIEDEPTVRDLVCEALQFMGYHATGAATGPEGLRLFERGTYEAVLTDLVMPGMTGWQVAAAVRRRAPVLGVIVMTATAASIDPEHARDLNVILLEKPFRLEALGEAVGHAVTAPGGRVA